MGLEHQKGFRNQMVARRKKPGLKGTLQAWPTLPPIPLCRFFFSHINSTD